MEEKLLELIWELNDYKYPDYNKKADEIFRLFVVSGSALHDKIIKQIPDEYKEQISTTIKNHYL
jgi:hypothetical protein